MHEQSLIHLTIIYYTKSAPKVTLVNEAYDTSLTCTKCSTFSLFYPLQLFPWSRRILHHLKVITEIICQVLSLTLCSFFIFRFKMSLNAFTKGALFILPKK